ncbi:Bacterial alpha-L-rhamnosidase [Maribellus comscasis]|uniref:alpha-L-rhamnosidase n=1 Tax=Maribellus comscasis TaxID=2681766 RepID=A0A6I6JP45_9BACT|nr:glycoside hydrolase family 78 protein [Maribellus comscasis]QGY42770.1 Bacterial alpha-L-rhamnosidase [Maribellus comscasis]
MKNTLLLFIFISIFSLNNHVHADVSVTHLKCEYLVNPIGMDTKSPRFSWQISSEEAGVEQQAYKLIVGADSKKVAAGEGDSWDSGIIESSTIPAVYQGEELQPFTTYHWQVKVQLQDGSWSDYSEIASFETGMMGQHNWKGAWISDSYDFNIKPAPYFRKEFSVGKKIKSARAYIAVGGLYELYLNGKRIGNHRLDPMYTRFDRRTLYVTYDVTQNLTNGENAVGVILGNGWYNHQSTAVWYFEKAPWRARPKFCMDLRITYEDGSEETVSTNSDWKTSLSPVVFNSIYTAEHYDARLEQAGWNKPGFDDEKWNGSMLTNAPSKNIVAQVMQPIRNVKEIPAQKVTKFSDTDYVVDFGRNMAGVTKLKIKGAEGTTVRLKHGERLYEDGHVDMSNIDVHYRPTDDSDPFQTDIVILSGKDDVFMPKFNYKGFQFVEVTSDKPIEFSEENLTAYFMHSDVPPVGEITSSNDVLNKTWEAANSSYLSNLFGYPTDCPQREKNGWTGDAQINIETGLYNFDAITVYEKWMADHRDEQQSNGVLPAIVPTDGWGYTWANGPDWTSTIAIIPWNVYLFYGDKKILADCYENIKLYIDHIDELYPSGITDWGLGDWVPVKSKAPKEFTSTAYYFVDATILAKAAAILGKGVDAEKYFALAEKIKDALNDKYLNRETGMYGDGLQTELSFPLQWNFVPDDMRAKVAANLAKRVEADDNHIDVGLLGTKAILNAMSENGYADLAYKVAAQETFPSWGWWIVNGATTFYENWPLDASRDISMNHIMFGEIDAWYYKALGGIFPDEKNPGFKNIILKPSFVEGLDHFTAKHESPYGEIVSSWKKSGKTVTYEVAVPANSTATVYLNGKSVKEGGKDILANPTIQVVQKNEKQTVLQVASGSYSFSIK